MMQAMINYSRATSQEHYGKTNKILKCKFFHIMGLPPGLGGSVVLFDNPLVMHVDPNQNKGKILIPQETSI
jgi:hypothetical protein